MDELRKKLMVLLPQYAPNLAPLAFSVGKSSFGFAVPGESAFDYWRLLLGHTTDLGYYPVLLGEGLEEYALPVGGEQAAASVCEEANGIDVAEFLRQHLAEEMDDSEELPADFYELPKPQTGAKEETFEVLRKGNQFRREVRIALVPTANGFEVPAYVPFGGFNSCPYPAEQIAVLKYWQEKYGAQLATMDGDTLELWLAKPVTDENVVMEIAKEQFAYCTDIVFQGTETVGTLARELVGARRWFFWWD